jgi:hypothetical protein
VTCDDCKRSHPTVTYGKAASRHLCYRCYQLTGPPTTEESALPQSAVPDTSSLVPSLTTHQEEPEVEQLLRMSARGELPPRDVQLRDLPDSATMPMRKVARFFQLVAGLRAAAGDERPVPFACGWVAEKTGLPKPTVHRALRQLEAAGVLKHDGTLPARGLKRRTHLWRAVESAEGELIQFPQRRTA